MEFRTEENILTSDDLGKISSEGFSRCFKTLEFDKILELLSSFAPFSACEARIRSLCPSVSFESICEMQRETEEAKLSIFKKGVPYRCTRSS